MFAPAYLDHNATTTVDPWVLEGMLPFLRDQYGNPSSRHEYGRAARRAVDEARQRVALALGAHPTEVVFTGSGTEAGNLFIKGVAQSAPPATIAISAIEHPCVREPARQLVARGWKLREIAVDGECRIDAADYSQVLRGRPAMIAVMLGNNETGSIQPVAALAAEAARTVPGAWFLCDAVQALGKIPVDFRRLNAAGVHALSVSAHKIDGPKGVGALIVDKRMDLAPLIAGGGQEAGRRSGTENVAGIVGFGLACEHSLAHMETRRMHVAVLRDSLEDGLRELGATIFAVRAERLPNTSFFAFAGLDGETLVGRLDRAGFAVASGSACSSADPHASHVLTAMGVPAELARGAVRVSFGAHNSAEQVEDFLGALQASISELRGMTALATR